MARHEWTRYPFEWTSPLHHAPQIIRLRCDGDQREHATNSVTADQRSREGTVVKSV
jgi:hypothetical protein